ncbi:B3 DNA binding domain [Dillenia turbinata]|uniref:B3 DNA binding domain n=1 Tax=Dillenia turbinata TaxID=194707 RepID=A0AAN8Z448_9MAGN
MAVSDPEVIKTETDQEQFEAPSKKSAEDQMASAHISNPLRALSPTTPLSSLSKRERKRKDSVEKLFQSKRKGRKKPLDADIMQDLAAQETTTSKSGESKSSALIRAEEVHKNLGPEFPSFVKVMVRSHVNSCFWMGLPGDFSRAHLPDKDCKIMLEDESGESYESKYFSLKAGLSAGWRRFSVDHKLVEGDALVFQLVEPTKFKVFIIKANDMSEVDGALCLLNLDSQKNKTDGDAPMDPLETDNLAPQKSTKRKRLKSLPLTAVQKKNKKTRVRKSVPIVPGQPVDNSENDSEEVASEVLGGPNNSSGLVIQFKDIEKFENFTILVHGLAIDSELSEHIRKKYYELCCSQKAFLHENLLKGITGKLIVGVISETVNIADAIRVCKLTTTRDEFEVWDQTLKAFEQLGMSVGFLRTRLHRLESLAFDTEDALHSKKYIEARTEKDRLEDEMRILEAKLVELKEAFEKCSAEVENLKPGALRYEANFNEEANAPW